MPPDRPLCGLKKFSTIIAIHGNDLPATSPHGSDFRTIRKFLQLHRFERSTRHSNDTPRQGLRVTSQTIDLWAMSRSRERIRAPALTTIAIFGCSINSSGRTCPLTPSCPLHQGMAVPSDHVQNFGRRERHKTIETSTTGAGLHLGAVQKATLCAP